MQLIYHKLVEAKARNEKKFAVLIDPDKIKTRHLHRVIELASIANIDYFFIGGSLVVNDVLTQCIQTIKTQCTTPVVLFPGSTMQIHPQADALLLLSLISGRNPDLLIGKHVEVAPLLARSPLQIIPTGYMLIDGGAPTSASYMSSTFPIPANKNEIAMCTALAGELLGLKLIYMDAGSGAKNPISEQMIATVRANLTIPIVVGGGIRTPERAIAAAQAGADVVVVGNAIEQNPSLILELVSAVHGVHA